VAVNVQTQDCRLALDWPYLTTFARTEYRQALSRQHPRARFIAANSFYTSSIHETCQTANDCPGMLSTNQPLADYQRLASWPRRPLHSTQTSRLLELSNLR
jgi:hypothetical protein